MKMPGRALLMIVLKRGMETEMMRRRKNQMFLQNQNPPRPLQVEKVLPPRLRPRLTWKSQKGVQPPATECSISTLN